MEEFVLDFSVLALVGFAMLLLTVAVGTGTSNRRARIPGVVPVVTRAKGRSWHSKRE